MCRRIDDLYRHSSFYHCCPAVYTNMSSELPYFCPRCGDDFRFSSVQTLRTHLVSKHTYETLLVLSQARVRSSMPGSLLPLPGQAVPHRQSSPPGMESGRLPLPLACLDLASSSSASIQIIGEMFGPEKLPEAPSTALALTRSYEHFPGQSIGDVGVCVGLSLVGIGLEERLGLGLDRRIARTFAEVEERVNRRVARLKVELQRREAELQREKQDGRRLKSQKQEVEEKAAYLSRQVSAAVDMMERLKKDLEGKDKELNERQQEMVDMECFLRDTAEKEAQAKSRLQIFIETLLDRADHAERQLLMFNSNNKYTHTDAHNKYTHTDAHNNYTHTDTHNNYTHTDAHTHTHTRRYTPSPCRGPRSLDDITDDITAGRMQETIGNRRSASVSGWYRLEDQLFNQQHYRLRTVSLGSCGWEGEGLHLHHHDDSPAWSQPQRRDDTRVWVEEGLCGRTWSKTNRRHHDNSSEEMFWSNRLFKQTHTPASDSPSSLGPSPSRRHGRRQLVAAALRLRAGLFCVFPYLDVRSLLRAAEVCCDWRFVARHPAVWTRVRLENARVSAEFLTTLSQWCTQTQSLVLNKLKPRSRRTDESREDYHKHTRGIVETGIEALLRASGGSLLCLSVSLCPHILTDRTLWLASCYSRNLHTLTYRSSSDPLGHEVLWALGAGCRNISSLQVAPAHPCQQPTRFGVRCLQTIGRCWPRLLSLSVGGASCTTQGLVALVRTCSILQCLELERVTDVGLQVATSLCENGLTHLDTLILTHSPVSGQAILHFHSCCPTLRSIVVTVSVSDYFEEPETEEAERLFGEILNTLKVLQKRPGLCDVLHIHHEGFC